ncbi:GNAT family N-acetyltransferase, partial [bacterium]|nr:GNAT family N-acetyltransferase [bacterium]
FAKPGKEDYFKLYKTTPWFKEYNLNIDTLYKSLENSFIMVTAYDNDTLVGFGRIISDGIIHAYIIDVIIHPKYRGMGYGKYIRTELINRCKSFNIPDIQIIENQQPLITLHGHVHESTRITGQWRDRIGRTHLFSAAHDGPELAVVRFDPDYPKLASRQIIAL